MYIYVVAWDIELSSIYSNTKPKICCMLNGMRNKSKDFGFCWHRYILLAYVGQIMYNWDVKMYMHMIQIDGLFKTKKKQAFLFKF